MKLNKIAFLILLLPLFCFAKGPTYTSAEGTPYPYTPWYTGPLIASGGATLNKGLINIQPYLHIKDTFGRYDKAFAQQASTDTVHAEFFLQFGLTHWMDIAFDFNYFYKREAGEKSSDIADTFVEISFQLLKGKDHTPIPWIRFLYEVNLPTGKYEKLNPNKDGIDSSGTGTFDNMFKLVIAKTVYWMPTHPMNWRVNAAYTYAPKTKVKGFNAYGGGNGTNGKVNPGNSFVLDLAFEFSFTQRWVFAFDAVQTWVDKTAFSGTNGTNADGTEASNTSGSNNRTSLAPALEYNVNENLGFIGGVHFSARGRNSTEFTSVILSVTYTW